MNEPDPAPGSNQVCVSFSEAVNWIAFSNFGGRAIGPLPFYAVFVEEGDESATRAGGRLELAEELLLSYAVGGKIRLYAHTWTKQLNDKEVQKHLVIVPPEFVANSYVDYEQAEGLPTLLEHLDQDKDNHEYYTHIIVDYDSLTNSFWGKDGKFSKLNEAAIGEIPVPERLPYSGPSRHSNRRGRPMKHKWSEFTGATVERCLRGPIPVQEDLVREMLEWCAEHWGEEPAISHVRDYVAPIFRQFEARWSEAGATKLAEKSEPEAGT